MILTGKCKNHFFNFRYKNVKWNDEDVQMFYEDSLIEQQAWIVQFFDSVGIYILPQLWEITMNWNYRISDHYMSDFEYDSRQEATKQAIIKANQIYNSL